MDVSSPYVPVGGDMKSGDVGLRFPVLGFTPDRENWGFPDLDRLTKCGPRTLKERMQDGMELIDADCRRWRVLSIQRTGRTGSWLMALLTASPQSRIVQELEELPAVSLADVQQRMRESLENFRADYIGLEGGESEFSILLEKVSRTRSIAEIYDLLQPDTFEPY
jgi:hypothetical protein